MYQVQVLEAATYQSKAERQYVHITRDLFYSRGQILFTNKDGQELSAASIQSGYLLAVNPEHVLDPKLFCNELESYLGDNSNRYG